MVRQKMFQSTPPRRGRLNSILHILQPLVCFNPRPRAGGDFNSIALKHIYSIVSIHAPAQGATTGLQFNPNLIPVSIHAPAQGATTTCPPTPCGFMEVSIHAPAQGATQSHALPCCPLCGFNPRPRAGGDWTTHIFDIKVVIVSIHAPAQGATIFGNFVHLGSPLFQSTPPRRGRHCIP